MSDLTALTLAQARDGLRAKQFSAVELAEAHLAAIESARALNAFVLETPEHALTMARTSDERLAKGQGGPLEGLPLGIKDLFCTDGVRTTACSHILESFIPPYKSTVTAESVARRRGHARQAQLRRIRHGLVERDLAFRSGGVAVAAARAPIQSWCPAVPRADRRRRWRRICASAPPAPTPAARSASRRRSAASSD